MDGGLKGSGNYGIFGAGVYSGQGGSQIEQNSDIHAVARLTYPFELPSGQVVEARESGGKLIIAPKARSRYRLADMLALCDPKAPLPADLAAWEAATPVGNEVL